MVQSKWSRLLYLKLSRREDPALIEALELSDDRNL